MQRTLFKEIALNFLLILTTLVTLVVITRVIHMRDIFLGLDLSFLDTLHLMVFIIPSFMLIVLPAACMLSIFFVILRMGSSRELISLKAGGVGILQLLPSPVFFSLLCTILALGVSLYGIGWGMSGFRSMVLDLAGSRAKVVVQPGVFSQGMLKGITFFARQADPLSGELKDVLFEDATRKDGGDVTVLAPFARVSTDHDAGVLVFSFRDGRIYHTAKENMSILEFGEYEVQLDLGTFFSSIRLGEVKTFEMSFVQLKERVAEIAELGGSPLQKALAEIQKRLSLPFACLILGVLALPLACFFEGTRQQYGIFAMLLCFIVYYALFAAGMSFGETGTIVPAMSVWLANGVFTLLTLVALYYAANEKKPALIQFITSYTLLRSKKKGLA